MPPTQAPGEASWEPRKIMKAVFGIIGVAAFAVATSVGFAQLQAATNPLLDYCPATPASNAGTCVVAANMLLSIGNPSDDALVAGVNAIAGQIQSGNVRGAACTDAAAGIQVLAAAIDDASTRSMAEALAAALCGGALGGGTSAAALVVPTGSLSTPVTEGCVASANTSGQTSGGTSGNSSGQSSGSSGQSSGTSGQTSGGTSGNTSGSSTAC